MRQDQVIICQQCGQNFVWTEEEQDFYRQKGLRKPNRCPICRASYKAAAKDKFRGKLS
jgi:rubrerythrin